MTSEADEKRALLLRKRQHLDLWLKSNPYATFDGARQELIRTFGESISTPLLNAAIRRIRDEVKVRMKGGDFVTFDVENEVILRRPTDMNALKQLALDMRAQGVTKIQLHADGKISIEVEAPKT